MTEHINFYENLKEAEMRLQNTIVMYDGEPYYVLCICDHNKDGIFRMYLDKMGNEKGMAVHNYSMPYESYHPDRGKKMDEFLEKHPEAGVIRRMMNSPKFNRFRPFPLGMANIHGRVQYLERTPTRHTQQGLTETMIYRQTFSFGGNTEKKRAINQFNFLGIEMYNTIMGNYPSAKDVLVAMNDPEIGGGNEATAFHRYFAFVRGPLDLMFLAYKEKTVGYMPHGDLSKIIIPPDYRYTKEVVSDLCLFEDIRA